MTVIELKEKLCEIIEDGGAHLPVVTTTEYGDATFVSVTRQPDSLSPYCDVVMFKAKR